MGFRLMGMSHVVEDLINRTSGANPTLLRSGDNVLRRYGLYALKNGRAFLFESLNAFFVIGAVVHFAPHALNALEGL